MQVKKGMLARRLMLSATLVVATFSSVVFNAKQTYADQITNRSLTLVAGATDGGSAPGGVVNHQFAFTLPSTANIGSIQFEYCTTASVEVCVTPTGLVTTSATLGNETGATGFTMVNTTNGAPYLTRSAASATGAVTYRLDTITNPTTENETFFVRISTFTSTDATTGSTDTGSVAASTATPIVISGTMPESLIFCTGETIGTSGSIPDCSTATPGDIFFDQLFSPTDTATTTSQMAASTNAGFGYIITVNGETLSSGANEIDAITSPTALAIGTGQFGLNLVENTTTTDVNTNPLGLDVAPTPDGVDLKGEADTDYATDDLFMFADGDTVASSTNGGLGPTNSQIFTVSYIVNVPGNQAAGTYTTTLTYICTPTF